MDANNLLLLGLIVNTGVFLLLVLFSLGPWGWLLATGLIVAVGLVKLARQGSGDEEDQLPDPINCPTCGSPNEPDRSACDYCGEPLPGNPDS